MTFLLVARCHLLVLLYSHLHFTIHVGHTQSHTRHKASSKGQPNTRLSKQIIEKRLQLSCCAVCRYTKLSLNVLQLLRNFFRLRSENEVSGRRCGCAEASRERASVVRSLPSAARVHTQLLHSTSHQSRVKSSTQLCGACHCNPPSQRFIKCKNWAENYHSRQLDPRCLFRH